LRQVVKQHRTPRQKQRERHESDGVLPIASRVLVVGHLTAVHRAICRRSLDFGLEWRERNNSYMRLTALVFS
jgi:hypothetical protein